MAGKRTIIKKKRIGNGRPSPPEYKVLKTLEGLAKIYHITPNNTIYKTFKLIFSYSVKKQTIFNFKQYNYSERKSDKKCCHLIFC